MILKFSQVPMNNELLIKIRNLAIYLTLQNSRLSVLRESFGDIAAVLL
jgi:hypothetical protein